MPLPFSSMAVTKIPLKLGRGTARGAPLVRPRGGKIDILDKGNRYYAHNKF